VHVALGVQDVLVKRLIHVVVEDLLRLLSGVGVADLALERVAVGVGLGLDSLDVDGHLGHVDIALNLQEPLLGVGAGDDQVLHLDERLLRFLLGGGDGGISWGSRGGCRCLSRRRGSRGKGWRGRSGSSQRNIDLFLNLDGHTRSLGEGVSRWHLGHIDSDLTLEGVGNGIVSAEHSRSVHGSNVSNGGGDGVTALVDVDIGVNSGELELS